ncbi:S41 family peptidase [Mucilaginibacter jinjuensis]|uniref:S41 family peptidase n=1 Tax=Mucilaginibacter jinjuensis TaxID=1176721 RepID=A0ABY7TA65_9SPHI|nr:S41 family peptidase [Mucilaginibacter jinjuensis]WCT13395.1 S41 family peptidase [Mucilaginibacter jinjuensis]
MKFLKSVLSLTMMVIVIDVNAQTTAVTQVSNLPKKETESLVNEVCHKIEDVYFDIGKGKQLSQLLLENLKSGKFYNLPADSVTWRITNLLRRETHDLHFFVGTQAFMRRREMKEGTPENYNGGFVDVKILQHNIGYIKYVRCIADSAAFEKIANAMNFLKGCSSILFDITDNPGGNGSSCGFINNFLFKGDAHKHLLVKTCRDSSHNGETEITYHRPITDYFQDIPVYIMTSKNTGSAAEYFAFVAQQLKRATILGQKTAGAANPVAGIEFDKYVAYIPVCQIATFNGKSFEGTGIIPDVQLTSGDWIKEAAAYIISKKQGAANLSSDTK